ncbi:alpha/beta fold hydrolase [Nocardioides houyundeii]|uniref:alpha/beta fold hydrolase n=1 Tax=Nocardioides houyundeii TaxID=2045452 RepID=UPI000DF29ED4|nr:alpha/beta fold hydrolase [Nocardioides houyundeii]
MTPPTLACFLRPDGFAALHPASVLREASVLGEAGRYAVRRADEQLWHRRPWVGGAPVRTAEPVVLVPGFLAGDGTLSWMARSLRCDGIRTYRSHIHANVGCTLEAAHQLEATLESVVARRGTRARIVGHSLGGLLARTVAARRPDLVSGIVTLGSPILAPGAQHPSITASIEVLVRLSRAGLHGLMSEDCVAGECARSAFDQCRTLLGPGVAFTAVWSRRDGIVDHRACTDPQATCVEVTASHLGMVVDPRVIDVVKQALARPALGSLAEVDSGVIA